MMRNENMIEPLNPQCVQTSVSGSVTNINANAVCLECGTTKENPENGFCINDHDNWLEEEDNIERFSEASGKFNKSTSELMRHIKDNVSITDR